MKKNNSNYLLYGLIIGGILSTGLVIYFGSKFLNKTNKNKRERKNKFYEGIDDIFEASAKSKTDEDTTIDKETEAGIIEELFSRTN